MRDVVLCVGVSESVARVTPESGDMCVCAGGAALSECVASN